MSGSSPYLLDTNIVLALLRANELGKAIDRTYRLSASTTRSFISIVSVGELLSFAFRGGWGRDKKERLESYLGELIWIDMNDRSILEAYAEMDSDTIRLGRKIGSENDLWIAATARVSGATLLTTDKDFDRLYPIWIDRVWIDPNTGKTP